MRTTVSPGLASKNSCQPSVPGSSGAPLSPSFCTKMMGICLFARALKQPADGPLQRQKIRHRTRTQI
ncbi:hypothetical protein [Ensifer canadensis]